MPLLLLARSESIVLGAWCGADYYTTPRVERCNEQVCDKYSITYSDWTPCNQLCVDDDGVVGTKTRTATCSFGDEILPMKECTDRDLKLDRLEKKCESAS